MLIIIIIIIIAEYFKPTRNFSPNWWVCWRPIFNQFRKLVHQNSISMDWATNIEALSQLVRVQLRV